MRIVWLLPNLHITGGSRQAVELLRRMAARGHEGVIVVPRGRVRMEVGRDVRVMECGPALRSPLWAIPAALAAMPFRLPAFDVLIASMPPYAILARCIGHRRRRPAVDYVLNDDVHFFDDRTFLKSDLALSLYRWLARRSIARGTIFVNSHWTGTRVLAGGGVRPCAIIPPGFDPTFFHPAETPRSGEGPTRLVTVGRRARWKGFDDLIAALNRVDGERYPFALRVISQEQLDTRAARFPLQIVAPKGEAELADGFRWGDVFIHTSWFEGFGMPPLEALACGLTVISTDCGGVREFLRDGENALLVSPREPKDLARAIERVVADPDLRRRLARRGAQDAAAFNWERVADSFEVALSKLA